MKASHDLGIYPHNAALDHDTGIYLREVVVQLVSDGVSEDTALSSIRRVSKALPK